MAKTAQTQRAVLIVALALALVAAIFLGAWLAVLGFA